MLGDLEDPEMQYGLDPELGEDGNDAAEGVPAAKGGRAAAGGTFKDLHKKLAGLKGEGGDEEEEDKEEEDWEDEEDAGLSKEQKVGPSKSVAILSLL